MKKTVNRTVLLSAVSTILTIFCICVAMYSNISLDIESTSEFENMKQILVSYTLLSNVVGNFIKYSFFILLIFFTVYVTIIDLIARMFQIGEEKKWKDTTSKILVIVATSLQILISVALFIGIIIVDTIIAKVFICIGLAINVLFSALAFKILLSEEKEQEKFINIEDKNV